MADVPTLSLIIPTISRPTLARALLSIRRQTWIAGDEVLLVGDGHQPQARALWEQLGLPGRYVEIAGPNNDWGHTPRNMTMPEACGSHLAALDDDDEWTPDALEIIRLAITERPDVPHLFRMTGCPNVGTVWKVKAVREGNVGTPLLVVPSGVARLGRYASRYCGDFDFISQTIANYGDVAWHEDVICRVRPSR